LLGIKFKKYVDKRSQNFHIKIDQVPEFFVRCRPALERKRKNLVNMTLKSVKSRLEIQDVVRMKETHEVYNLETETDNYIVNGFLVHNCDNNDTMAERDSGWLQFYAENNQEALDLVIQAYKIAENKKVLLPGMIAIDAYTLTHTFERVDVPSQTEADAFLPTYKPLYAYLDPKKPITQGAFGTPEHYMEFKYSQQKAMEDAEKIIDQVFKEFGDKFGRKYQRIEAYKAEDADILLLTLGSMSGTGKEAIDRLRKKGIRVGLAKFTVFRPFPAKELIKIAKNAKMLVVIDRNISLGYRGALFSDAASALANLERRPLIVNFIVGLGGRDISIENFYEIVKKAKQILETKKVEKEIEWIGIKKEMIP
jgi:pyruvate ferredoxin oxidoreductase alpha subunit